MSSVTAIALHGAAGRMGLAITRAAATDDQIRIVAAIDRPSSGKIGADAGRLAGVGDLGVPVADDLGAALADADVLVDLSHPDATEGVVAAAETAGVALICGTTGLGDGASAALSRAAATIPVLAAANLSPGIAVMTALLGRAVAALGQGYDIEIAELHHRGKIDAPSGTALALARAAAAARGRDDTVLTHGRQGRTGARPTDEIGVLALRGGGVFGEHTALLLGEHERLEISHRAASRELFALGALRAALFLNGQPPGRYTMADVLGL